MNIKCKYNVGDKVYRVESSNRPLVIPGLLCPACKGAGEVRLEGDRIAKCAAVFHVFGDAPARYFCQAGKLAKTQWMYYADKYPFTVEAVIAYNDSDDETDTDISYEVSCGDAKLEVPESKLFSSFEEAQIEADHKNSESKIKQEVA